MVLVSGGSLQHHPPTLLSLLPLRTRQRGRAQTEKVSPYLGEQMEVERLFTEKAHKHCCPGASLPEKWAGNGHAKSRPILLIPQFIEFKRPH